MLKTAQSYLQFYICVGKTPERDGRTDRQPVAITVGYGTISQQAGYLCL